MVNENIQKYNSVYESIIRVVEIETESDRNIHRERESEKEREQACFRPERHFILIVCRPKRKGRMIG